MKGIVFTEFLNLVEEKFGYEMVDQLIEESDLASGGVYTAIGTYDHAEIVKLVTLLSEKVNIPVPDLLQVFAHYFSNYMVANYEPFFEKASDTFDFLSSIHDYIHVEVKKLYPDAELPHFAATKLSESELELIYTSQRKMGHFALGLIESSIAYYKEEIAIDMENLEEDGSRVRFHLQKS